MLRRFDPGNKPLEVELNVKKPAHFIQEPICLKCNRQFERTLRVCPHCGTPNPIRISLWSSLWSDSVLPIFLLLAAILASIGLFLVLLHYHHKAQDSLSMVATVATIVALILGGYWGYQIFIRKRQKYPHAAVDHTFSHWRLPDGRYLLHLVLKVINKGEVLLTLAELDIWIGKVMPWPEQIPWPKPERLDATLARVERANVSKTGCVEVEWPLLVGKTVYFDIGEQLIEPGEEDELHFDFPIPGDVELLHVYTHLRNVPNPMRNIGWPKTTFYTFRTPEK